MFELVNVDKLNPIFESQYDINKINKVLFSMPFCPWVSKLLINCFAAHCKTVAQNVCTVYNLRN